MKRYRAVVAVFAPPLAYLLLVALGGWRSFGDHFYVPVLAELKDLVIAWVVASALGVFVLHQLQRYKYWHFVVASTVLTAPVLFLQWWMNQAGESVGEMLLASGFASILISPVVGLVVWLLAVGPRGPNNALERARNG